MRYSAIIVMYSVRPWLCYVKFVVGCSQHNLGFRREHFSICGVRRSRRCRSSHVLFTESSQIHQKHRYIQEGWTDSGFRRCILELWRYHCHKGNYGRIERISRYDSEFPNILKAVGYLHLFLVIRYKLLYKKKSLITLFSHAVLCIEETTSFWLLQ